MQTKRTLFAVLAGLLVTGLTAFAGPDSWKGTPPQKPKGPCCAVCLPKGACCEVQRSHKAPNSGRDSAAVVRVLCNDTCAMPQSDRRCCAVHCVR